MILKVKKFKIFFLFIVLTLLLIFNGVFSRLQEYSPSEAAKVYEKPMNRRNIAVFSPEALMRHLDGAKSNTDAQDLTKTSRKLAEHFRSVSSYF